MSRYLLDAKKLLCPLPVIRTQQKLKELNIGDELEVICTDPGALEDIPAWCRIHGQQVISKAVKNGEIRIVISKTI